MSTLAPFPAWEWNIPDYLNIGAACTDAYLGTAAQERVAMIVEDDERGTSQATYRELAERSSRFAQLLRAMGVAAGDRVLIRLPNSIDYATAFLGALKRGAIAVPTSTLLTGTELRYLLEDSEAVAVVIDEEGLAAVSPQLSGAGILREFIVAGAPLARALQSAPPEHPPERTRPDDPAYLVYTSGTTGYPKGVLHGHRSLLGRTPAAHYWFDFPRDAAPADGPVERILHSGKFNWTYVLGSALMDPLFRGQTVIVHEGRNDAATWPRLIAKHAATVFIGVPTIYRQVLQKTTRGRGDVPTLRHCMSAGEHLSDEVFAQWRERFGLDIYEAVGMSECSYYLSHSRQRPIRPGSAGFAQPGHGVRLLDPETLAEAGRGEEGMICIPHDDPGLFLRYWNLPEETAKVKRDGWFFTGDYAREDEDGYLWFLGRKDDIIKSFGYRVSPYEVERVIKGHPGVADCACVAEDAGGGKTLVVAYVIPQEGSSATPDELLEYGRSRLASYKAPRIVYFAREFPRTRNGKVLRREISSRIAIARSA